MKKLIIAIFLGVILLTGCTSKLKTYEEVDYNKIMNMFEEKQDFVLFIGSTTCDHCSLYKVTLDEVIKKYQVKVYYIDISKLTTEENNKLKLYVNYSGTPTTAFIENGVEESSYDRVDGNRPMDKVVEKFKNKGYIN